MSRRTFLVTSVVSSCKSCPYVEYDRDAGGYCTETENDDKRQYNENSQGITPTCPHWKDATP